MSFTKKILITLILISVWKCKKQSICYKIWVFLSENTASDGICMDHIPRVFKMTCIMRMDVIVQS